MKPWRVERFDWNEGNESELAAHQITVSEVEEVFYGDPTWSPNRRERSAAWKMVGFTKGGRALTIVVEVLERSASIRPVTGWACSQGERTRYLKGQP
jgi:uncharacterized DUF497 family protein